MVNVIAKVNSRDFVRELLTPTERIMLAKRLSLVLMLKRGFPFSVIERTLKVSPSTVLRFWLISKQGSFATLTHKSAFGDDTKSKVRHKNKSNFWDELESLILLGMPRRASGTARWDKIRSLMH